MLAALAIAGCGGKVVVSPDGGGSGGSSTTSSSASSSASSSSGAANCPGGCPMGTVCLYGSGTCAPTCDPSGLVPCGKGLVCNQCATGSCPGCEDCVAACLPAQPGQCDDHDDCAAGSVCIYGAGKCAPKCDASAPSCPTPDLVCNPCATSPCPGCDACLGACTESF
jgi:hypothetical protein